MKIKNGAAEYKNDLWLQIRKLVYKLSRRYMALACGIGHYDMGDVINTAWLGVERAICDYDPQKGYKFTSYLHFHIHNSIKEMLGIRGKKELLDNCISLNTELHDTDISEPLTLLDTIEDETARQAFDDVDDRAENAWIWEAVNRLDTKLSDTITKRYKYGKTLCEIGMDNDVSIECIRQREKKALRLLQKDEVLNDYRAEMYGYMHIGVSRFNNTWTSSTELAVLKIIGA